ncbi:FAD-binding oxidoreductase [Alicyclobacillus tolerans]|uniref:Glycolate oxidase FAD binding subunit n=1 Tax=Alicyclobacillus tolerans TaxID=90970 RepID=A0A1M6WEH3_9BACL|nr:FAD-binding oxidoreductase [Alicyclobacillus montanus]SHK92087.1 glycolate oxidase FAD binding subunit [Alicyclobacillus montanus]
MGQHPDEVLEKISLLQKTAAHFLENTGITVEERAGMYNNQYLHVKAHSPEAVVSVMNLAGEKGWRVHPCGAGTIWPMLDDDSMDILLDVSPLQQCIEYSPADMVITVQSGMSLQCLQNIVHEQGQHLPVYPVCHPGATVGGLLAANHNGPERVLYGTWRDLLIGARVVMANGELLRTGGKVVKNVAGYDMSKLWVGSYGSLGILTECTFKLRPLPLYHSVCLLTGDFMKISEASSLIRDSSLIPSTFEWMSGDELNNLWDTPAPTALAIGCHENQLSAEYQADFLRQICRQLGIQISVLHGQEADEWWQQYRQLLASYPILLQIQAKPTTLPEIQKTLHNWSHVTGCPIEQSASQPVGVLRIYTKPTEINARLLIAEAVRLTRQYSATLQLLSAPLAWRSSLLRELPTYLHPVEQQLMKSLKQSFDPNEILPQLPILGGGLLESAI